MNTKTSQMAIRAIACGMAGWVSLAVACGADTPSSTATVSPAPAPAAVSKPSHLSFAASEVLKLSRAKVGDDTIVAFVKQSSSAYDLSAEDIVYLRDQGVTDRVVSTMLTVRSSGGSTAELASAPAPAPTPSAQPAASVAPGQTVYPGGAAPAATTTTTVVQPAVTYVQPSPTVVYTSPVVTEYYGGPYYYGYGYPYYGWRPGISVSLGFGGRFHGGGWHVGVPIYRGGFHHR